MNKRNIWLSLALLIQFADTNISRATYPLFGAERLPVSVFASRINQTSKKPKYVFSHLFIESLGTKRKYILLSVLSETWAQKFFFSQRTSINYSKKIIASITFPFQNDFLQK